MKLVAQQNYVLSYSILKQAYLVSQSNNIYNVIMFFANSKFKI